ncbi:MAG: ATPase, T2SS/T4P/T4SS family, partial [Candidatus Baltobacteraceae bacterium]
MNTGHDGSLTTVHANSPRDAMSRIETMVMMAGFDLPIRAIREQVASAIDLVVQTARMRDGTRKIMSIAEVVGMEGDIVTMQEIVTYKMLGYSNETVQGQFEHTGVQPQCIKRFEEHGIVFDATQLGGMALPAGLR